MDIELSYETDVVVVGAGLAGIKAANDLSTDGTHVVLLSESKFASGASFHPVKASLGTQVTRDEADKACFRQDIRDMGEGMHNDELARIYIDEIAGQVERYPEIGISARKLKGDRKACFAGHDREIYLLSDWDEMRRQAATIVASKSIRVLEKHLACCCYLVDGRIAGVFALDSRNRWVLIQSRAVILASGGFTSIYKHSLYPPDVDGSGHMMALDAGAELVNMEFVQFIPALVSPKYGTLFGEHTLRYVTDMADSEGRSLLRELAESGHDVDRILAERSGYAPFSHTMASSCLDIAMMHHVIAANDESGFRCSFDPDLYANDEEFFKVYLDWLDSRGIHFIDDDIRILPFAHAANGGVAINRDGDTGVAGLYAIGELSANVEGANRLGGNSTGACMVFGARAALACRAYIATADRVSQSVSAASAFLRHALAQPEDASGDRPMSDGEAEQLSVQFRRARNEVKEIMYHTGGIVRTETGLQRAIDRLTALRSSLPIDDGLRNPETRRAALKITRQVDIARISLEVMNERKESRGAHYRQDYPTMNPQYGLNLFFSCRGAAPRLRFGRYDSA